MWWSLPIWTREYTPRVRHAFTVYIALSRLCITGKTVSVADPIALNCLKKAAGTRPSHSPTAPPLIVSFNMPTLPRPSQWILLDYTTIVVVHRCRCYKSRLTASSDISGFPTSAWCATTPTSRGSLSTSFRPRNRVEWGSSGVLRNLKCGCKISQAFHHV